jgi:hypothetical protein
MGEEDLESIKTKIERNEIILSRIAVYEAIRRDPPPTVPSVDDSGVLIPSSVSAEILEEPEELEKSLRFLMVGCDKAEHCFKIIEIFETGSKRVLMQESESVMTRKEMRKFMKEAEEKLAKRVTPFKLEQRCFAAGVVGVLRLAFAHHLVLISETEKVACIMGRDVFGIKKIEYLAIQRGNPALPKAKNVDVFYTQDLLKKQLEVNGHMFFSYEYDLTTSLLANVSGHKWFNPMFCFNFYQANRFIQFLGKNSRKWIVPVIQGFVGQISM